MNKEYHIIIGSERVVLKPTDKVLVKKLFASGDFDPNGPYYLSCEELYDYFINSADEYFLIRENKQFINNIVKKEP